MLVELIPATPETCEPYVRVSLPGREPVVYDAQSWFDGLGAFFEEQRDAHGTATFEGSWYGRVAALLNGEV